MIPFTLRAFFLMIIILFFISENTIILCNCFYLFILSKTVIMMNSADDMRDERVEKDKKSLQQGLQ